MSNQPEDRELEDYLHRKSALSLGYKSIYVEAPSPELDRAVSARARRALRWLGPAIASFGIALGLVLLLNSGVGNFVGAMVKAERHKKDLEAQQPVTVDIAPLNNNPTSSSQTTNTQTSNAQADIPSTESVIEPDAPITSARSHALAQWRAKIKALRATGNTVAADTEQRALDQALARDKQSEEKKQSK